MAIEILEVFEDILYALDEELVCYCAKVSKGKILSTIKQGAKTLEDIKKLTVPVLWENVRN